MNLLVAIPVFNEAKHLAGVLAEVRHHVERILVIDDGSTDGTPRILDNHPGLFRIRHPENRGYGQSICDAFAFAIRHGYDWLITMDCDRQHEPARIPAFIDAARAGSADLISGSRYLQPGCRDSRPPADRRKINRYITDLLNEKLGLGITDAFCGFKAHRVESLGRLKITVPGYAMPLQLWVQVARHALRVAEIPVELIYNDPNRHFGGPLDDPQARLAHYLEAFAAEMAESVPAVAACGRLSVRGGPSALSGRTPCESC